MEGEGPMKTPKIACLLLALAFAPLASVSAVDVGGALYSVTEVSNGSPEFGETGRLTLWLSADLGENTDFYLQAGTELSTGDPLFVADVDRLFLKGAYPTGMDVGPAIFNLSFGRDNYTDFTGLLLNHPLDGIRFGLGFKNLSTELFLAFSGLVLKPSSRIVMSSEDYRDQSLDDVYLGSKRLLGGVSLQFPELFLRQQLDVSALFQEDLRPLFQDDLPEEGDTIEQPGRGGALDSQYVGVGLRGALVPNLFYNFFFYLGTGRSLNYLDTGSGYEYAYSAILSFLTGVRLRYYLEPALFSRIDIAVTVASGDGDFASFAEGNTAGYASAFVPVSQETTVGQVFTPALSNLVRARASYSFRPFSRTGIPALEQFVSELAVFSYLRPTAGPISETGIDPSAAGNYLGTEIDLRLNYRPFSDLLFNLSGGVFLPNRDIFVTDKEKPAYKVALEVTLEF
jgi:hypothetical protein